jgi:4'-phosphopantetheinyl transferase
MRLSAAPRQSLAPWRAARNELHLPPGEVHLWWVGLQVEGPALCACWDLLLPEETRVASGYRFVKDLREFVVTRAVLRQILARYTGQSPADLRFESNPGGKAVLQGADSPHFSVSHCSDIALLAVARARIGIDVEHVRPGNFWQKIIEHCLSPRERAYLEALPEVSRTTALYRFWTRKEAVLKAMGTGLLYPPQQVSVLPDRNDPSVVNLFGHNWLVRQVPAPSCYEAAAAIEAPASSVKWRQWRFPVGTLLGQPRRPMIGGKFRRNGRPHNPLYPSN